MTKSKKGFTLIELVVVMAIIAVLAALMVFAITAARRQSVNTQRTGQAKTLETALETYASKNTGKYPVSAATTPVATMMGTLVTGKYLTSTITGVDDTNFVYTSSTDGSSYGLATCEINNTTPPTVNVVAATAAGCTGSAVTYKTFR